MIEKNPELLLLAHCFDSSYREAVGSRPSVVNWGRFERLVRNNKLSLLAYTHILGDDDLDIPRQWRTRFRQLKEEQEAERTKLADSVAQVNRLLGDMPYALVKTYRPFPYHTHDLDILVEDTNAVGRIVTATGIPWDDIPRGSVQVEEPQWLHLEFYERALPGSIQVVDDDLTLRNSVPMTIEGVPTFVASPEMETLTLLADAVLRLYELKLGDMVYIYTLAEQTDWHLLEQQAGRHGWREPFLDIVGVLNGYHRAVYGSASPVESLIKHVRAVPATAPYVTGWRDTARTLSRQGNRHLVKLVGYLSVRLKLDHPRMHQAYVRFFQVPVGRFVLRQNLYR